MKSAYLLLTLLAIFLIGGCGGGGDQLDLASPFTGRWAGAWHSNHLNTNGHIDITVSTNGTMSGTIHNSGTGISGTVFGGIGTAGMLNGTIQFPGEPASQVRGQVVISDQDHLIGDLVQTINGTDSDMTIDLPRQ